MIIIMLYLVITFRFLLYPLVNYFLIFVIISNTKKPLIFRPHEVILHD